ncbi:MAG: hypothetical protein COA99_03770 [Moraxellaceae bacterium]|nr:MAG: hypothetical protein COA99_03770 [Moraxellaceae bacterium]
MKVITSSTLSLLSLLLNSPHHPLLRTLIFALASTSLLSTAGYAETLYIKDEIRIEMHSGPTTGYRIIRYLKSGDTLNVIERSDNDNWLRIEAKGREGWIQAKYTSITPIAKALLKNSKQKIASLGQKNDTLAAQLTKANAELTSIKTLQSSLQSSNNKLNKKLSLIEKTASNAITTERSYQLLQEKTELLNVSLEKLEEENKILASNNLEDGIIWGIIAVFAGVILTLCIPKMSSQKPRSEW